MPGAHPGRPKKRGTGTLLMAWCVTFMSTWGGICSGPDTGCEGKPNSWQQSSHASSTQRLRSGHVRRGWLNFEGGSGWGCRPQVGPWQGQATVEITCRSTVLLRQVWPTAGKGNTWCPSHKASHGCALAQGCSMKRLQAAGPKDDWSLGPLLLPAAG